MEENKKKQAEEADKRKGEMPKNTLLTENSNLVTRLYVSLKMRATACEHVLSSKWYTMSGIHQSIDELTL